MIRPNFNDEAVILDAEDPANGKVVRVAGTSDDDTGDIIDIVIVLIQGTRSARLSVDKVTNPWFADIPVKGAEGEPDFAPGPAVAHGTESRNEHATTITWVQPVAIT